SSKGERELPKIPVCRVRTLLHRNKELLGRTIGAFCILDEEEILPLKRSRQPEVKTNRVNRDVGRRAGSKVVVRELRDNRVRIFNGELVQESHVTELTDRTEIGRGHNRIAEPVSADIASRLEVQIQRHLAFAHL